MWFGTDRSVSKFDGVHWSTYIPDGFINDISMEGEMGGRAINALAFDQDGNKWILVSRWNEYWHISWPEVLGSPKPDGATWPGFTAEGEPIYYMNAFAIAVDGEGDVWIGTDYGVSRYVSNKDRGPSSAIYFGIGGAFGAAIILYFIRRNLIHHKPV